MEQDMSRKIVSWLLAVFLLTTFSLADAQQTKKIPRIGFLGNSTPALEENLVGPFREGLRDLGYVEGKNIVIEWRWAEGKYERFPTLIAELIALNVDLIVTAGTPATIALKKATTTIAPCHDRRRRPSGDWPHREPRSPWRKPHRVDLDLTGARREAVGAAPGSGP